MDISNVIQAFQSIDRLELFFKLAFDHYLTESEDAAEDVACLPRRYLFIPDLKTPRLYRPHNKDAGGILLMLFYINWWTANEVKSGLRCISSMKQRNRTYPLTPPITLGNTTKFRIGIVADLDQKAKCKRPGLWHSYYKKGFLTYNKEEKHVTVSWDSEPPVTITSSYSRGKRGMELSELIVFDGRLLTFDDRSGMVYELLNNNTVVPRLKLQDGNGYEEKGFKVEWATVKDEMLYIGSTGKERVTDTGDYVEHYNSMWIKTVNIYGDVHHINWMNQYKTIRSANGIKFPGYMIHEAVVWSPVKQKWYFLPRKCNSNPYIKTIDELIGCSYLISVDAEFSVSSLVSVEVPKRQQFLGFSSLKFVPGTYDEVIVALKTMEYRNQTSTYITVFTTDGKVLLPDTHIENNKYEGIEFI